MKNKKRLFTLFFALLMFVTALPLYATAATTKTDPVTIIYTPPNYFGLPFYGTILTDDPVDIQIIPNDPNDVIEHYFIYAFPILGYDCYDNPIYGDPIIFVDTPAEFSEQMLEDAGSSVFDIYVGVYFVGGNPPPFSSYLIVRLNVVTEIIIPPKPKG